MATQFYADADSEESRRCGQDSSSEEDDGDETSGGSVDIVSGAGDHVGQSAEENEDSSSDNSRDGDEGKSPAHRVGQSAEEQRDSSSHKSGDGDKGESHVDRAPSISRQRGVQTGNGLTRSDIKDMLLDQRVLFEMLPRTVKLEIVQHVTAECNRLQEFISTVVSPHISTTSAAPHDVQNDPVQSPQQPRGTCVKCLRI